MAFADLVAAIPHVTVSTVIRLDDGTYTVTGTYGTQPFTYRSSFEDGHEVEAARQVGALLAAEFGEVAA